MDRYHRICPGTGAYVQLCEVYNGGVPPHRTRNTSGAVAGHTGPSQLHSVHRASPLVGGHR